MTVTYTQQTEEWCDPCALSRKECGHVYPNSDGEKHRGQARIAYRLAAAYSDRLMYVKGIGWHVWDGSRWARDERDEATTSVLAVLRTALAESLGDGNELRADVRKCETANGIRGVLEIASALPALRVAVADLDADPYLVNCANGTLDLRTRQVRAHDPADRITKVTRGAYRPEADGKVWEDFLATILPDEEERAYLQRIAGQTVYGAVREHLFPILTGTGANGKGTTYGALVHAMGDYARVIDPGLLMADTRTGGPEMMELMGARLVVGSETEDGQRLDAALMKRLTGGDAITARNLYSPPVTWSPSHQIMYVTNHMPEVDANDPAVWRRIRVIPFNVTILPHQKDSALPERLEQAADAIVTWAIRGWFDYEDNGGMRAPESVTRATDGYRDESDPVKQFIDGECFRGPEHWAGARDLHSAWAEWAMRNGHSKGSEKWFTGEVKRLGYSNRRAREGKRWEGIAVPSWFALTAA